LPADASFCMLMERASKKPAVIIHRYTQIESNWQELN
jgi:hypothetical protein